VTSSIIPPDLLSLWELDPIQSILILPPVESAPGENVAFVETVTGARYVLKRKTIHQTVQHEYRLLEALAAQGMPVAVPLRAHSGKPYVQVGDDYYDLSPRLPGTAYTDHYGPGAEDRARQFGAAIAWLHAALRNCDQIFSMPDMDLPGDILRCRPVVHSIWQADQRPPGTILDELETGLADCFAMLPQQLLHRDAHPGNMLFQDGQLTGWIDFELMERGPRIFDLCYCSTSLLMNGLDDPARRQAWPGLVRALVEGYDSVSPLTPVERGAIRMVQMAIGVLMIAWLAHNNYPIPAARNIVALAWLYENPYEL
jgi:Ser/Thr protein kinase RdoA (MazF antagonist)